jgi:hypothetical protein
MIRIAISHAAFATSENVTGDASLDPDLMKPPRRRP